MALIELVTLVSPPRQPAANCTALQLEKVQDDLGVVFPGDYRDYCLTYGSGRFRDESISIRVYNACTTKYMEQIQEVCQWMRETRDRRPAAVPFAVFPESPGLLPWGADDLGNDLFWLTIGEPNNWPVVARAQGYEFQRFEASMTSFLAKSMKREIKCILWKQEGFFPDPKRLHLNRKNRGKAMHPTALVRVFGIHSDNNECGSGGSPMGDGWQRYFPAGSLDPRPDLHRHQAEWFADALERLKEPPLHPSGSGQPLVVRVLCLPTWRPACSVRVEAIGLSWQLTGRELDGEEAGFELGQLFRRVDRVLSTDEAARLSDLWAYLKLWSLGPAADGDDVLDGTMYVVEAAEREAVSRRPQGRAGVGRHLW